MGAMTDPPRFLAEIELQAQKLNRFALKKKMA